MLGKHIQVEGTRLSPRRKPPSIEMVRASVYHAPASRHVSPQCLEAFLFIISRHGFGADSLVYGFYFDSTGRIIHFSTPGFVVL